MKTWLLLSFLVGVSISSTAWAQLSTRCSSDDRLTTAQQRQGRNAWARKCGYISATKEAMLNMDGEYQVFYNACFKYPCAPGSANCAYFAPASVSSPCISGLILLGTCSASLALPAGDTMLALSTSTESEIPWWTCPSSSSACRADHS